MKSLILQIVLISFCLHSGYAVALGQQELAYVPNEILFKVKQPFTSKHLIGSRIVTEKTWFNDLVRQFEITMLEPIFNGDDLDSRRWYKVKFRSSVEVLTVVRKFKEYSDVLVAEPNGLVTFFSSTPDDPGYQNQWGLPHINMPDAWDLAAGSQEVIVAVIDLGIRTTQEDLTNQLWVNPDEELGDANGDGYPGIAGIDDDGDGLIDEDSQERQPGEPGLYE